MFYSTSATVLGSFSVLARRIMVPLGLLVCLFSGVVRADDGDDTLRFYLSKSDVVVLGEFTSESSGLRDEVGVINHVVDFKISQLLKGKPLGQRRVGGTIQVNIVRYEFKPEDRLPEMKKGGKCILFLKYDRQATPSYITADFWFGVQRPSPTMARSLARLAKAQTEKEGDAQRGKLRDKPRDTKIVGSHFHTLLDPLRSWVDLPPEKRWAGKLSKTIFWEQVERIHILQVSMAIALSREVSTESIVRDLLEGAVLLKEIAGADNRDSGGPGKIAT